MPFTAKPYSAGFSCLAGSLLLLFSLHTRPVWGRIDTLRTFPEKRFVNGVVNFGQYVASKLRYPLQAQQAAIVGTSLVSFAITPAGKLINVAIVNSLGKAIDGEVMRVIHETSKLWLPVDKGESQDSVMLFLSITFHLGDIKFYVDPIKPDFLLDEILLVGYNPAIRMGLKEDAYYVTELNSAAQEKDYNRMLKMVNELIRRNPYSDKLYFQRATIERALGQTEEACSDYKKIIYLLGKTHFPKHFLKNCADLSNQIYSATTSVQIAEDPPIEEEIFTVCEVPPSFPGGLTELDNYIRRNLRYPEAVLNRKVNGKVFLSFIVMQDGSIRDIDVLKDIGFGTTEEAVRLIRSMPRWNPGNQAGRPVNVKYNLVIPFRLADAK